jgi:hypothetical protein
MRAPARPEGSSAGFLRDQRNGTGFRNNSGTSNIIK